MRTPVYVEENYERESTPDMYYGNDSHMSRINDIEVRLLMINIYINLLMNSINVYSILPMVHLQGSGCWDGDERLGGPLDRPTESFPIEQLTDLK